MAGTVLELVVVFLKLVFVVVSSLIKWKVEERNRFEERMKTISKLFKEAVINKDESLNEGDYLSNLEWEKQNRYKAYRQASYDILVKGGGIGDLSNSPVLGMGLRINAKKEDIIKILLKNLRLEEKAQWISKKLVDSF